ncbi:MAG: LysR family transcriptional regulator [Eubacteriales bacterium]|nr:LysR family transcriptional regulator [Eubacteriales bacterium]
MDLHQIEYFVKCAETESFSKAAELLFTTQPNVSRVIKSLEEDLGKELFERDNKGIHLTEEGLRVYRHACSILESMEHMKSRTERKNVEMLRISTNPSSRIADGFLQFYQTHREKPYHYEIHSAGTREIVERVQNRTDDLGIVFVLNRQLSAFQYYLRRNYLEFMPVCSMNAAIYFGNNLKRTEEEPLDFRKLRLIQRFPEEYSPENYWDIRDVRGQSAAEAETVVTTNSDYIMQRMLTQSDLVNISGENGKNRDADMPERMLLGPEHGIVLGGIKRSGEEFQGGMLEFWTELQEWIQKS